eukprot:TRINITY_DN7680_c0_g1_i2.p1 TRINITY_DN7680_c0_g1~~TRINITY_DN7680_c0_g1_i2.p1  ORF type:complete len:230 (+),score=17.03 TRINITY_DN7680_c0_g1_i2:32-721(+)
MNEEDFEQALKHLKALNNLVLERIQIISVSSLNNVSPNNIGLKRKLNKHMYQQQVRQYCCKTLCMNVNHNQIYLSLVESKGVIELPFHEGLSNFNPFRASIPTQTYFDMAEAIGELGQLNPKLDQTLVVFNKWKEVFEKFTVALGEVENKISNSEKLIQDQLKLFDISNTTDNFFTLMFQCSPKFSDGSFVPSNLSFQILGTNPNFKQTVSWIRSMYTYKLIGPQQNYY